MAALRRRVALIEVRLGIATDDTYDDLDDVEVQAITGMTMDEHRKQRRPK